VQKVVDGSDRTRDLQILTVGFDYLGSDVQQTVCQVQILLSGGVHVKLSGKDREQIQFVFSTLATALVNGSHDVSRIYSFSQVSE
jgi:hypothetical protein